MPLPRPSIWIVETHANTLKGILVGEVEAPPPDGIRGVDGDWITVNVPDIERTTGDLLLAGLVWMGIRNCRTVIYGLTPDGHRIVEQELGLPQDLVGAGRGDWIEDNARPHFVVATTS